MPDSAAPPDRLELQLRRLYLLLRSLLPNAVSAEAALRETIETIRSRGDRCPEDGGAGIAREAAARHQPPFSTDLNRQLSDSAGLTMALSDKRPAIFDNLLRQLPPPERDLLRRKYELGMTSEQIGLAENRPVAAVTRELVGLHATLVSALQEALPDGGPEPPGGASDLGRLAGQFLDGTISDDGRLVLETLLLGDAPAQAHYHRHVAVVAELTWKYRGPPALPDPAPVSVPRVIGRERIVTWAFVTACMAAILLVVLLFAGAWK